MSDLPANSDRFLELLGVVYGKCASGEDFHELNSMLLGDDVLRQRYLSYCRMHVALRLELRAHRAACNACQQAATDTMVHVREADVPNAQTPSISPIQILPITNLQHIVSYLSSGWPLAYFIATVIFAIGAVIGSHIYVSHPVELARGQWTLDSESSPEPLAPSPSTNPSPKATCVGQITSMVDCVFKGREERGERRADETFPESRIPNPKPRAASPQSLVCLGDTFHLASGLLEITYDTGAKVILQGPVTYEVDSADGGFLSQGKLTARVEKDSRSKIQGSWAKEAASEERITKSQTALTLALSQGERGPDSTPEPLAPNESSNPQSLIPNPSLSSAPLFAVRTPTAIVTDLGTEFGVEVDKQGCTTSHIFRGTVKMQITSHAEGVEGDVRILRENESARIEVNDSTGEWTLRRIAADPADFVLSEQLQQRAAKVKPKAFGRWKAYSDRLRSDPALTVHYDFQQRADSPDVLHARADGAPCELDGRIEGAVWAAGPVPGKQALYFDGDQANVKVKIPQPMTQMTLATWIAIDFIDDKATCMLLTSYWPYWPQTKDGPENCNWQVYRGGEIGFDTTNRFNVKTAPILPWQQWGHRRWHHLAVVVDPAARQMIHYLDGKKVAVGEVSEDLVVSISSAKLGNWWPFEGQGNRAFRGSMAELTILARVITEQEMAEMFEAGKP